MPILAVVSITVTGEREIFGFRVGNRENQAAWEVLLFISFALFSVELQTQVGIIVLDVVRQSSQWQTPHNRPID